MNNKITKGNTAKLPGMRLFDEAWQPIFEKCSAVPNEMEGRNCSPLANGLDELL